jgi:DNA-binding transcriptional LysR family regulator
MLISDRATGAGRMSHGTPAAMAKAENNATNAESLGLDHLRAFLAVVEKQTQVAAARQLRVTQATIARHIYRVQEHFGGWLFDGRSSGKLSTRGLLVEQSVRVVLAELARTRERMKRNGPVLRIGYIPAVRRLLETALRTLRKTHGALSFCATAGFR